MAISKDTFETMIENKFNNDIILIDDFSNISARTLMYGYTLDNDTIHLYLKDGKFIKTQGDKIDQQYHINDTINIQSVMPSKRVYPESMDEEFFKLLLQRDISIPFTSYNTERYEKLKNLTFHGYII